jgi:photosystem II stability/assembly factor-like uncharacterized protein
MKNLFYFILISILFFTECKLNAQWITLNSGTSQNLNSIYFTDSQTGYACGAGGTVIKTTNAGQSWAPLVSGISAELKSIAFINAATGFICGYSGTIIMTTNSGLNWSTVSSGSTNHLFGISFANSSNGICAGNSGTMLYTTNGGLNWFIGQPEGFLISFYSAYMVNASTGYIAGVNTIFSPLVGKTTNSGANWTFSSFYLNTNEGTLRDIYFFDTQTGITVSNVWNGTGAISKTTSGGANWTTTLFTNAFYGVDFSGQTGYAVGFNGSIFKSTDSGTTWSAQTCPVTSFLIAVDFIDSITGYAAGDGGTILKTTNGGAVGIIQTSGNIPQQFSLSQNYPNPFNPSTKIKFDIPAEGKGQTADVKLIIYNSLGQQVAELINQGLSPGTYEVEWNAADYPSEIYFYKLTSADFTESKKMILIK